MGIYIHIPFCRNKCFYCGFYSVASLKLKDAYVRALCREMDLRKDYLVDRQAETLYLGGGTPSYLDNQDLEMIIDKVNSVWNLDSHAERSIELNPEDVTPEKMNVLRQLGFNRLTIGIQSFNESILKRINRTHDGDQAREAVEIAANYGFDNIGIDLILGLPGSQIQNLEYDLNIVNHLPITHISVYILSIDSNTVLERLSEKGKFKPQDDDRLADQYLMMSEYLKNMGFEHYEISNFAKNSKYSHHNISYWQQKPYIGLGASAHSFNLRSRQWNVSNIKTYIESLNNDEIIFEKEELTVEDKYNEYLMTNFRTMWGIDISFLCKNYSTFWGKSEKLIKQYCQNGFMINQGDRLRMSERGWLISDGIFSELFV